MADVIEVQATDLAAMLCSRVCHDLINPVGAIGLGLDMLRDEGQAENWAAANDLIANSARQAEAKLQYARVAFGGSSSAGTELETRELERVAKLLFAVEKADLEWAIVPSMLPKNKGKLLMNMLLISVMGVPRGGLVHVAMDGPAGSERFVITSTSDRTKKQKTLIPSGSEALIAGNPPEGVDARGIQPFYTGLLARLSGMVLSIKLDDQTLLFVAEPKPADADASVTATPAEMPASVPAQLEPSALAG